jgi:DNA polymerase-1
MIYFIGDKTLLPPKGYQEGTLKDCLKYLKSLDVIGVDTETTGNKTVGWNPHSEKIICIQLGDKVDQWVIDCEVVPVTAFKSILENKNKLFLLQNAKFDLGFLYKYGIEIHNIYDTFLAECVLTTGIKDRALGLSGLTEKYCGVTLDKSIRTDIHLEGLTSRVIIYGAKDIAYLQEIKEKQDIALTKHGLHTVLGLENEVVKVFARMEYTGVAIDVDKWLEVADITEANLRTSTDVLDEMVKSTPALSKFIPKYIQTDLFGEIKRTLDINWSSNAQKLKIVKALNIDISSVADKELQKNKGKHDMVKELIHYSKQAKLSTSFGRKYVKFINKDSGRIHPSYWQILNTGRISCKEPNLNQVPSKGELARIIRSCFIPRKGYKIVGGDYSGMELRIIAEFSKDPLWVNAFNEGKDLHSVLCAATFDIDIKDVKTPTPFKPDITYRDVQKTINFGLAYGMSKYKLADTMQIEVAKADEIIKKFFQIVPDVDKFLTTLGNLGTSRGYIKSAPPYSRIRFFDGWARAHARQGSDSFKVLGEIERASKNTPIQGTNADIIKLALVNTQKKINEMNYPVNILLSVYDEIQTECEESFAPEWAKILDKIMVEAAKKVLPNIPIIVDCEVSSFWTK